MTVKEAYKIVKSACPDKEALGYNIYRNKYIFSLQPIGWRPRGRSDFIEDCCWVDKDTGELEPIFMFSLDFDEISDFVPFTD